MRGIPHNIISLTLILSLRSYQQFKTFSAFKKIRQPVPQILTFLGKLPDKVHIISRRGVF